MHRMVSVTALVVFAWLAVPRSASGQLVDVDRYYNPFTGRMGTRIERYNPFTGQHSEERRHYNPWTGQTVVNRSYHNHYIGGAGHFGASYNPLTGRYGYRYHFHH
jgi:hypothetical protein